jgi:acyl-CoA synthetase (AMP-forming)/AMP-acid ligase II
MQDSPPKIGSVAFYSRAIRKLSRPGVLPGLISLQRLSNEHADSAGAVLARRATETPDSTGIRFEDQSYTWAQINDLTNRHAEVFRSYGVGPGDVVAINLGNRPEFIFAFMGATKLGAVAALINSGLAAEPLDHCYRLAGAKAAVIGEEQLSLIATASRDALPPIMFFVPDRAETPAPAGWQDLTEAVARTSADEPQELVALKLGDPAAYIYTSGTTGLPKAAVVPHRKLVMGGIFSGSVLRELTTDDVIYGTTPLFHITGLLGGWFSCVRTGATFVPARSFSASRFWDEIRHYDVTGFNYVGEIARYLWNQPPSATDRDHHVRTIMGAGLRHDIWDDFKDRFGIAEVHEVYGGSETPAGFVNLFNFDRTCGWNPRGWKIAAWDSEHEELERGRNGFARAARPGESGLLLFEVNEKQHFDGYTDKAATESKLRRDVFSGGDSWYDSGDLMFNQGHGHASFVDRLGDTFRWHAENVATSEVETALLARDDIDEAIVYGVEVPGHEGRAGAARIFLAAGVPRLDGPVLASHLRSRLPEYAVPRFIRVARTAADVTGTFRHKKADLKQEGFGPGIADELYLLAPGADEPVAITDQVRAEIESGGLRL